MGDAVSITNHANQILVQFGLVVSPPTIRDRPFNLQEGGEGIFFPQFNIRLYDKNSELEYFFQQHWESEYFF